MGHGCGPPGGDLKVSEIMTETRGQHYHDRVVRVLVVFSLFWAIVGMFAGVFAFIVALNVPALIVGFLLVKATGVVVLVRGS